MITERYSKYSLLLRSFHHRQHFFLSSSVTTFRNRTSLLSTRWCWREGHGFSGKMLCQHWRPHRSCAIWQLTYYLQLKIVADTKKTKLSTSSSLRRLPCRCSCASQNSTSHTFSLSWSSFSLHYFAHSISSISFIHSMFKMRTMSFMKLK